MSKAIPAHLYFQRLSVVLQRFDANLLHESFMTDDDPHQLFFIFNLSLLLTLRIYITDGTTILLLIIITIKMSAFEVRYCIVLCLFSFLCDSTGCISESLHGMPVTIYSK